MGLVVVVVVVVVDDDVDVVEDSGGVVVDVISTIVVHELVGFVFTVDVSVLVSCITVSGFTAS